MKANRRVLYALLLAVMAGTAACEQSDQLGEATAPVVQQSASRFNKRSIELLKLADALTGDVTYVTGSPVGRKGAVLNFGGHRLVVPRNAVSGPTHFSATLRSGDELKVDLRAWEPNGTEVSNFGRRVQLVLDYSDATNLEDATRLGVYYHRLDGTLERMPSSVDKRKQTVSGLLNHFSDFSGGFPRNDTIPQP
jgi:hypothetical protein